MIRVISPVGKLQYVDQVQPVCEKHVMFNGRRIRLMEPAKDWFVEPTVLALRIGEGGVVEQCDYEELQIGNLKPEKVLEIVRSLGEKEYYDFSTLNFQNAKNYDQVVWDNGESDAYCNSTFNPKIHQCFCRCEGWTHMNWPAILMEAGTDGQIVDRPSDSEDLDWDSLN